MKKNKENYYITIKVDYNKISSFTKEIDGRKNNKRKLSIWLKKLKNNILFNYYFNYYYFEKRG